MSVIVGFSFPEEAVLISDSRISFAKNKVIIGVNDDLRKIFALTPQLAIGYTSDDVNFTHKILLKLQWYIQNQAKNNVVYHLLKRLPKVVAYEYKKISKTLRRSPAMELMYAGILSDRSIEVPEPVIMNLLTIGGGGAVPEPIGRALMTMKNGYLTMAPPTPVIMKQHLPSGEVSNLGVYTVASIGSGSSIENLFTKEYSKLMTSEPSPIGGFRSNLIRLYCDQFIKESNIPTVGGAIQVLSISTNGVKGVNSSFKRIYSDSSVEDISSMDFDGENWIWRDHKNGKVEVIKTFSPPLRS